MSSTIICDAIYLSNLFPDQQHGFFLAANEQLFLMLPDLDPLKHLLRRDPDCCTGLSLLDGSNAQHMFLVVHQTVGLWSTGLCMSGIRDILKSHVARKPISGSGAVPMMDA